MVDLRKIAIIFVIAALYSVFVFTLADAVNPEPDRSLYCSDIFEKPRPLIRDVEPVECPDIKPSRDEVKQCSDNLGNIDFEYDNRGCVKSYECSCEHGLKQLQERKNLIDFIIFTIFALVAVLTGIFLPHRNTLNEWVGTGFMLGGLITLFIGTARFFGDLAKPIRPIVILAELIIVLYLSYKKLGDLKKRK